MKLIKNKVHIIRYSIIAFCVIVIFMSFDKHTKVQEVVTKNDFKYEGTYSLYIGKTNHYNFRWITESADIGRYEILDNNNNIVLSGDTDESRSHRIDLDKEIEAPFTFKFGGKNSGMHQVKIKSNFDQEKTAYKKVDSLYVIGDIHGRYDQLITLLTKSKIIDEQFNWTAGNAHIVFLGDIFDRGDDVTKVLWFIYQLEDKAAKAGGKSHLVLGNHEIMTMTKDLRYLSRKEKNISIAHGLGYQELFDPINSVLGSWLRSKVSLLKIDHVVLSHGGILDIGPISLEEFNNKAYFFMKEPMYLEMMQSDPDSTKYDINHWMEMRSFFFYSESPYWYRGYVLSDTLGPQLNSMLKKYNSKLHVVAHTTRETITQKYDGKLLTTDLDKAATELLLLVRQKKKYQRFKIDSEGIKTEL